MTALIDKNYEAYPINYSSLFQKAAFGQTPVQTAIEKWHRLLSTVIRHESFFTDYTKACAERCGACSRCQSAKQAVTANLIDSKSMHWEVWSKDPETEDLLDFVGILRLSNISPGCDATAHYFFFDGKLHDKTPLLKAWARWTFDDHEGWLGLERVTVEVPAHAFALARHANKKLLFGGPFKYTFKGSKISVEGIRRKAVLKDGVWQDSLIMGRLKQDGI